MTRALVTGAAGFIGRHLVRALLDRRMQVVCLGRRSPVPAGCFPPTVEYVVGDIRDTVTIDSAIRDVDWVFHLAAATAPRTWAESRAVTVDGTHAVATVAARQTRPPLLVYVSSLAAVGPSETLVNESSPCRPISYYGRAKHEAEQLLQTFADRLQVTVVRPPCVFGRGDRNLLRLFRLVRRGWELHADPRYQYSFLHVADLVEGLITAAAQGERLSPTAPSQQTGVYFLADQQSVTFPALSDMIAHCLHVARPLHVRVPYAAAWIAAALGEVVQVTTRRKVFVNRDKVREAYGGSWICDPARARAQLRFAPARGLAERLAETHQALAADGWL